MIARLSLLLTIVVHLVLALIHAKSIHQTDQSTDDGEPAVRDSSYWLKRRDEFFKRTTFELTEDNKRLIGGKYSSIHKAHLPFWFDYQLFKYVFNKPSAATPEEELSRHHTYINTCMRTLISRTLFRMLAAFQDSIISSDADQFYSDRNNSSREAKDDKIHDRTILIEYDVELERNYDNELPLDRAVRLIKQEMSRVESKNQVETYLRAFDESDGTAIMGNLPY